jgi:Holliday junction resolvase RusA-like endonuclease
MVGIYIKACFSIPKSTSKKKHKLMLENIIRPTKKPDADNIAKIVCDALNGIAFLDDKQIVDARITKWYSDTPRIEIIIQEIE